MMDDGPPTSDGERVALLGSPPSPSPSSSTSPSDPVKPVRPLSIKNRLLFGTGNLGVYGEHLLAGFFFQNFLLEVARLGPALVGLVLLLGQFSDILSTALVGKLSDNMMTRWGRRRPWLLLCAIPFGATYVLSWQVFFAEQYYMFAYYSCVLVVVNALSNSISIPLNALGPELIHSYDQATSLMEVRVMMEIIFGVLVAFLQSFLSTYFKAPGAVEPDYVTGYQYSAILFGILFGLSPLLAGIFLKEKQRSTAQIKADTKVGFLANLRDLGETFRARNFVLLMLMYFMCWTSIAMVQNNLILLVKYAIRKEDHFMWLISLVQITAALGAFGWSKITVLAGKRNTYLISSTQWVVVLVALFFFDESAPLWAVYALTAYAGLCLGAGMLLPSTMLPDVVDEDELVTGTRREGAFYSLFILLQKIGLATALAGSSWILAALGYTAPPPGDTQPDVQPPDAVLALKLICGPAAAVLIVMSTIPMLFYSLSRSRMADIQARLLEQRKKRDEDSTPAEDEQILDLRAH